MKNTVIIVTGPTASGKTRVAIDLAVKFQTEIISADSRQCYRELNIGVARPSPGELQTARHHFIASHSIHENNTAADFEQYSLQKVNDLFKQYDKVIMVGGTGLYIKAFCDGLDSIPPVEEEIRERITQEYNRKGLAWLQEEIRQKDPAYFEQGEIKNPRRMMRALEVIESTGKSIISFRNTSKKERDFRIVKFGLYPPNETLRYYINSRIDRMIASGLIEEAEKLYPFRHLNALQTVGYQEMFHYFDGEITLEKALELIKQNTRKYAKRQLTWFRKDKDIQWFDPSDPELLLKLESKSNEDIPGS